MAQQKKKQNARQNPKVLAAQYRNDFFRKMKFIIDCMCGKDIFPLIPSEILNKIYLQRCTPFKIVPGHGSNISDKFLKKIKVVLPALIKKQFVTLSPSTPQISLSDFYTVVLTIPMIDAHISDTSFKHADRVKAALKLFCDTVSDNEDAYIHMQKVLCAYCFGDSDLREVLYWLKHDIDFPESHRGEVENNIRINTVTPEIIHLNIDGSSRPAIRVGWAFASSGALWTTIKPSALGIKHSFAEIPLKVYMQKHALNRLMERIDCFWVGLIQFNMYVSLFEPKIAYDSNKNLLIEYSFFNTKAGYFRADIVDGIILLRTFLFVTNNGTPEGQLLEKNTGLQKMDKMYLSIDKLSTFMNSDLDKNDEVQRLFKNSGCQCLIDLYNNMKPLLTKTDNDFHFDLMLSYLNLNSSNTTTDTAQVALQLEND